MNRLNFLFLFAVDLIMIFPKFIQSKRMIKYLKKLYIIIMRTLISLNVVIGYKLFLNYDVKEKKLENRISI